MATLTTSWKSYASASFSTGPATITFYLEAKYSSQSVANNTTSVQTRLRSAYTKGSSIAGVGYKFTCTYCSTVSGSGVWTFENETITSGGATVTHNSDGTKTLTIKATAHNDHWNFTKTLSASVTLPSIPRKATVTNGTDFNDETAPKVTFNNPAGFQLHPYLGFWDSNGTRVHLIQRAKGTYTSPYTWSFTEAERNAIRSALTSQKTYTVTEGVTTYSGSSSIGASSVRKTFTIINANPTFDASYEDINSTTLAITGDNQLLIQNQSTLQINITNATAYKSATLSSLKVVINGVTYNTTISGSTATFNIGALNISQNIDAVITLTDSRGYTATQTLNLQFLGWQLPTANITLQRQNNYYSQTDITVDANYSSLDGQNTINIYAMYKKTTDSTYSTAVVLQDNVTTTLNLDNLYEWDVQVVLTDRLGTTTYNLTVGKGMPIIYFDRLKRSVGVNCFPNDNESLEVSNINILRMLDDLFYKNGDQITGYWYVSGYVTTGTRDLMVWIYTPKSMKNISRITISGGDFTIRTTQGNAYLDGAAFSYNASGKTATIYKQSDNMVLIKVTKSSAYTNVSNNVPVAGTIDNLVLTLHEN